MYSIFLRVITIQARFLRIHSRSDYVYICNWRRKGFWKPFNIYKDKL